MTDLPRPVGGPEPIRMFSDRDGAWITEDEWARHRVDPWYVLVAQTVRGDYTVLTTWEGVTHNRTTNPLPFRTRVTQPDGSDQVIIDSATETLARTWHRQEVARIDAILNTTDTKE